MNEGTIAMRRRTGTPLGSFRPTDSAWWSVLLTIWLLWTACGTSGRNASAANQGPCSRPVLAVGVGCVGCGGGRVCAQADGYNSSCVSVCTTDSDCFSGCCAPLADGSHACTTSRVWCPTGTTASGVCGGGTGGGAGGGTGGGNSASCSPPSFTHTCTSGLACTQTSSGTSCCPVAMPYACPGTTNCYSTASAAAAACGISCVACANVAATLTCATAGGGTCQDSSFRFCGTACCPPQSPVLAYPPSAPNGACYVSASAAAEQGATSCTACAPQSSGGGGAGGGGGGAQTELVVQVAASCSSKLSYVKVYIDNVFNADVAPGNRTHLLVTPGTHSIYGQSNPGSSLTFGPLDKVVNAGTTFVETLSCP